MDKVLANTFAYEPVPVGERTLLQAVCLLCGETILGSVWEHFEGDQIQHVKTVHPEEAAKATSV